MICYEVSMVKWPDIVWDDQVRVDRMKMVGIKSELGKTDKARDNKMSRDIIKMAKSLSWTTNHSLNDQQEGNETGEFNWLRDKIPSLNQK